MTRLDCKVLGGSSFTLGDYLHHEDALEAVSVLVRFITETSKPRYNTRAIYNGNSISVARDDTTKIYNSAGLFCIFTLEEGHSDSTKLGLERQD